MSWLYALAGIVLILGTMVDIFWTVITARGAGPLSSRLVLVLHKAIQAAARMSGARVIMALGGPLILCLTFIVWVVLLWAGWWLLFRADPQAVLVSSSDQPGGVIDRLYFVGFTLSTLGIGDLKPGAALWQVLTALMAMNGLIAITLAITYTLSVLSAVISGRQYATQISALGGRPQEIVADGFDGRSFAPLQTWLPDFLPGLLQLTQSQLAFPILHTFQSLTPRSAQPARVALLAEALLLLREGVAADSRPPRGLTRPLERAIDELLLTMIPDRDELPEEPPPPDLRALAAAGVPVVDEVAFRKAVAGEAMRRRHLHAMVRHDGWSWNEIVGRS